MKSYIPPMSFPRGGFSVFLAGTIDGGNSRDWQKELTNRLTDMDITILNPRRWAAPDDIEEQILWELSAMEAASMIVMNFEPDSQSPITLLEFGRFLTSGKLVVSCPVEYYRSENVYVTANFYQFTDFADGLDGLEAAIRERFTLWKKR